MKHRHVNRFTVLHIHRYRYTHRPSRLMHFDDYSLSKYTKSAVIVLCICKQTLQNRVAKEMRDRKRCQHTNALEFLIRNRSLLLGFLGKVIRIKLRTKAKICTEQQQQQQLRVNKQAMRVQQPQQTEMFVLHKTWNTSQAKSETSFLTCNEFIAAGNLFVAQKSHSSSYIFSLRDSVFSLHIV